MALHAIVVAHPNAQSFSHSVARAYCRAVERRGHETIVRDLYQIGFSPVLQSVEIANEHGVWPAADVANERTLLARANVFCFVYPVWFCLPPAILSGYIQRVFGMGFGYGRQRNGENERLLRERSLISFSSSGAPSQWLNTDGSMAALQRLFDQHVAAVCGMKALQHKHFGSVHAGMTKSWVEGYLDEVDAVVASHFS